MLTTHLRTGLARLLTRAVRDGLPLLLLVGLVPVIGLLAPARAAATEGEPPSEESRARYTVVDIGITLPGRSDAVAVNESGVVAGNFNVNGQRRGFVYQGGTATPLPLEEGLTYASVTSIGDDGTIGGWAAGYDGKWAVLWKPTKDGKYPGLTRLDTIAYVDEGFLDEGSGVLSVNAHGDALTRRTGGTHAAIYRATGGRVVLQTGPDPTDGAEVDDFNDNGQTFGAQYLDSREGGSVGALWSPNGGYSFLPTPTGEYIGGWGRINNNGEVIANGSQDGQPRILHWADDAWTPIGGFMHEGTERYFGVEDFTDNGLAVGSAIIHRDHVETRRRAMVWHAGDDKVTDLNTLIPEDSGWLLGQAYGANERGQIVGAGARHGGVTAYVLDPTGPVVFVPGAAASMLVDHDDPAHPEEIWLGCGTNRLRLSLDPNEEERAKDVRVTDAARSLRCGPVDGEDTKLLMAYGVFLSTLKNAHGYREYQTGGDPQRRTTDGCDVEGQQDRMPNLFVFAYDWRRSNAEAADQLKSFIGCVRKFYPEQDIDIVSHSMGGLVARRYVIDNPEHHVRKHISIGAPWLGAPKLVNVLNTGDFIPAVASGPDVKRIMAGFPAPHQLMSAQYYHQLMGPVFREDGQDYDGDGNDEETYDWDALASAINGRWPTTTPARTAADWHGYRTDVGGQVDWRNDASGVDYVHIHGVQDADVTIGSVTATRDVSCKLDWIQKVICTYGDVFETGVTRGDGTVPTPSATRVHFDQDLNAEGAEIYPVFANGTDSSVEHTALMWHPEVIDKTVDELREKDDAPAARAAGTERVADDTPATPYRYIRLRGLTPAVVTDADGNDNAVLPGTDVRDSVPGVSTFAEGTGAELVALPVSDRPWTVDVRGTGQPGRIEIREGSQEAPVERVRYDDLAVPEGVAARLRISASGVETLRLDEDGDGTFETLVPPTSLLSGPTARDVTAPGLELTAHGEEQERRYTVAATDDESGVREVLWSTDGETYRRYTEPIDPGTAQQLFAVATDHAGNRALVGPVGLGDVEPAPLTTAIVTPGPNAAGWSTGDVTVALRATKASADAADVVALHWSRAGTGEETEVRGTTTTIPVTSVGTTVLRFRAETADGGFEPWRSVAVRIDAAAPTASLRAPRPGSVVPQLTQLAGRTADDASGVASVEVTLQRTTDGRYWSGTTWQDERTWLTAGGRSTWRLMDVPRGTDLPEGAYAVRLRVADNAGRTTLADAGTFRVAADAAPRLAVLDAPDGAGRPTSAAAINDHGVAAGVAPTAADTTVNQPVRWDGGRPVALERPTWARYNSVLGLDGAGRTVGNLADPDRSHAAMWADDGTLTLLDGKEPGDRATALGVSSAGVVGVSADRPALWNDEGELTTLPGRDGMTRGAAEDVDSSGAVVGHLVDDQGHARATVWEDGRARSLGDLGGGSAYATAVNDVGQAVGTGIDGTKRQRPFIVDLYDGEEPRPIYVPGDSGKAHDVNDAGQVVGEYVLPGSTRVHGFLESDGVFTDLNQLLPAGSGWEVVRGYGINDVGQVLAFAMKDGVGRAVILSAEHAPTATDLSVTTDGDSPVTIILAGADVDPFAEVSHEVLGSPAHGSLSAVDGATVVYTPARGFTGTDAFTYRAFDGRFRSGTATVTITVEPGAPTNTAPSALLHAPATAPEGSTVSVDAGGSTDPDGTVVRWEWDLDDDGAYDDATGPKADVGLGDDGARTVRVRVTDDDGAVDDAAATIEVEAVAPVLTLAATTATAVTGEPWSVDGTVTDPGNDLSGGTVDTGSGPTPVTATDGGFTVGATFPAAGTYPVVVRFCDEDACSTATVAVTVSDAPLGDVRATWAGSVAVPGTTRDVIALSGALTVRGGKAQGLATIARTGQRSLALGLVQVTGGGTYVVAGQQRTRVTGTGTILVNGAVRKVGYVLELVDGGKADSAWIEVTDAATGKVVPDLSLPRVDGRPALLPLKGGNVQRY